MRNSSLTLAAAAGLLMAAIASSPASAVDLPGPLIDVDWLDMNRDKVVLLDVRKDTSRYTEEGHIPGAILLDWAQVRGDLTAEGVVYEKMLLDEARFEQLMQAHGVDKDSAVVIAHGGKDAKQFSFGARLYWQLKYYGHDSVALLDGGTAQWKASGRDLTRTASTPEAGDFQVKAKRDEILATTEEVEAALADGSAQLLDSRPVAFYLGLEQRKYVNAPGHIPRAKNVPFSLLTPMKGPGVVRPDKDLRMSTEALGVDPAKPIIAYCNSGHVSAGTWFALYELLGNKEVQLYDGSLHAWTKDAKRPMVAMRVD